MLWCAVVWGGVELVKVCIFHNKKMHFYLIILMCQLFARRHELLLTFGLSTYLHGVSYFRLLPPTLNNFGWKLTCSSQVLQVSWCFQLSLPDNIFVSHGIWILRKNYLELKITWDSIWDAKMWPKIDIKIFSESVYRSYQSLWIDELGESFWTLLVIGLNKALSVPEVSSRKL